MQKLSSTKSTRRNLQRLLPTYSSVHGALHVHIVLNTIYIYENKALMHCSNITDAEVPYSQTIKWTGSVHLHSYSLHICLFFPEGAPPALGEQWKSCWWCSTESVSERGGSKARPGISNRHTESQTWDQPHGEQQQSREERAGACWKHTVHQYTALKPRRYCFT